MKVAKQLTIEIENKELLDVVRKGMPDYDIESILALDSFFKDNNLYLEVKLRDKLVVIPLKNSIVKTRVCIECNKEKELSDFSGNPEGSNGLNTKCKDCRKQYMKEYHAKKKKEATQSIEKLAKTELLRAPNQTALFLNWLEKEKPSVLDIEVFAKQNSTVTLEQTKVIVAHQIRLGNLQQLSATQFRVKSTIQP